MSRANNRKTRLICGVRDSHNNSFYLVAKLLFILVVLMAQVLNTAQVMPRVAVESSGRAAVDSEDADFSVNDGDDPGDYRTSAAVNSAQSQDKEDTPVDVNIDNDDNLGKPGSDLTKQTEDGTKKEGDTDGTDKLVANPSNEPDQNSLSTGASDSDNQKQVYDDKTNTTSVNGGNNQTLVIVVILLVVAVLMAVGAYLIKTGSMQQTMSNARKSLSTIGTEL